MSGENEKTTVLPAPKFLQPDEACSIFRKIFKAVEDDVRGSMTLPPNIHDRHIAIQTLHNVLDRMEEAIARYEQTYKRAQAQPQHEQLPAADHTAG